MGLFRWPFWFKLGLIDHRITNPWSNLVDEYNKHKSLTMILFKNNIINIYHYHLIQ